MALKDYQDRVHQWASQFETPYWKPHEILARLTEETGELAREVNHMYGPKKKKPTEEKREMGDELADIIFTSICLANSQKIDLDESMERLFANKLNSRDANRFQKK